MGMKLTPLIFFAPLAAFFAPIALLFHVCVALILFDLVTAIMRSYKLTDLTGMKWYQKVAVIKSSKLRRTVLKMFTYNLMIGVLFALDLALTGGALHLAHITLGFISLSEIFSITENCDLLNNNNVLSKVMRAIRTPLEGWLNKLIGNHEKN